MKRNCLLALQVSRYRDHHLLGMTALPVGCRRVRVIALFCFFIASLVIQAQVNVTTQHNDNSRTGQNAQETILTSANVNSTNFGRLFSVPMDGYLYAQPLYLSNLNISNGIHNVVFVATEHDSVYAIDADVGTILWHVSFINPGSGVTTVSNTDVGCNDLIPEIGITGTPVIDASSGTIYVLAKTKENSAFKQRLHALDVTTGAERPGSPVEIVASVSGTGDGSSNGVLRFDPLNEHNRPGLLLQNGHVIIGWASHCDVSPYHGWIMSYNASSLAQEAIFNTTPTGGLGGVWMGGGGLAGDSNFNVYFATGNGTYNGNPNFGDSAVKLGKSGAAFSVLDWFTPYDQLTLENSDIDLGSGGVVLLPDQPPGSPHQHLLVQAGKEGSVYLINRDNMGHFNANNNNQIVQSLPNIIPGLWGLPAWWNNSLYIVGTGDSGGATDHLKAFTFNATTGLLSSSATSQSAISFGFPGPTPAISSNGTSNGIVWLIQVNQFNGPAQAVLRAFNATNLATELYNSQQNAGRDNPGAAVKFTVPTIANGKVYVGTQTQLTAYGELSPFAGMTLNPGAVTGGNSSTGTVLLNSPAPSGGATVSLASGNTSIATVPSSVTVPAGSSSATFQVSTSAVTASTSVSISGTYAGTTQQPTLIVNPWLSSLALSPSTVAGGDNSTGTVTLTSPAPAGGITVTLVSGNTAVATVPSDVTVLEGATTATFTVTTSAVSAQTTATITATYGNSTSATLTVNPVATGLTSLSLNPPSVTGGVGNSTGTVTLNGSAPSAGAVVSLSSSNSGCICAFPLESTTGFCSTHPTGVQPAK